ncbi:hypothetical protein SEA_SERENDIPITOUS_1 [Mycobacterium phage Serendipitous]|uniref:ParB-like nuclease domain protein n=1 Tax=Mycobacterium phage Serendipitous TaxID=2301619 RepID=A0A385UIA4_9CAUD|nr:ParB-like partition protein [Mycobacterium phage Serendipitous]AYB70543.1 hypothetical protein SEA_SERENDIPITOUS_1 [Mycobacterium phage Serendipitous]
MASTSLVGKTTSIAPSQLTLFHKNPRKGDVSAIASSLRRHTQYKPITANVGTHTGRPNEVLAGNHTLLAFRDLAEAEPDDPRWRKMLVHWVDVDDDLAERIVVADNQTSQLGGFDVAELVGLIEGFGEDIEGLGFTDADISDLNALYEEEHPITVVDPFGGGGETSEQRKPFLDPETGLMNVKDIATNSTEYADQTSRMVVMSLAVPHFVWAQEQMTRLRGERGVETNSELLLDLLAEATGETPPHVEASESDAETSGDDDGFESFEDIGE